MQKRYEITIEGTAPTIQNRLSIDLINEQAAIKNADRTKWEEENWDKKMYKDGEEIIFPEDAAHALIIEGGKKSQLRPPKSVGRTWTNYLKSSVFISDHIRLFDHSNPVPFGKMVNANPSSSKKTKVYRIRPLIENWKARISIIDLEGSLSKDLLEELLTCAGKFVGLSDYRPVFGRFKVLKIQEA